MPKRIASDDLKNNDIIFHPGDGGLPNIKIIGCGGAGNNIADRLYNIGVDHAEIIAVNTDKQHLDIVKADKKVLIGKSLSRGLGDGGFPELGMKAAEMARNTMLDILIDADLVFITAGMGGGAGTGASPVIAEVAKNNGALVVCFVTIPFKVERSRRIRAEEGIAKLRAIADVVIELDLNKLVEYTPNLPLGQAYSAMDRLVSEAVKSISEIITRPSLINLDYADFKSVLTSGGIPVMLVGEAEGADKSEKAVRMALDHPLRDIDYHGAAGALAHITGGPDMNVKEAEDIVKSLVSGLGPHAKVIWGATTRDDFEGKVKVLAIMSGILSPRAAK